MQSLRFLFLLIFIAAATALMAGTAQAKTQSNKPNILIICNLGMMGYKTPNIDRIAKEGALFHRCVRRADLHASRNWNLCPFPLADRERSWAGETGRLSSGAVAADGANAPPLNRAVRRFVSLPDAIK